MSDIQLDTHNPYPKFFFKTNGNLQIRGALMMQTAHLPYRYQLNTVHLWWGRRLIWHHTVDMEKPNRVILKRFFLAHNKLGKIQMFPI